MYGSNERLIDKELASWPIVAVLLPEAISHAANNHFIWNNPPTHSQMVSR